MIINKFKSTKLKSFAFQVFRRDFCIHNLFDFYIDILSPYVVIKFHTSILGCIGISFSWNRRQDYATIQLEFYILNICFVITCTDHRRWNTKLNAWEPIVKSKTNK